MRKLRLAAITIGCWTILSLAQAYPQDMPCAGYLQHEVPPQNRRVTLHGRVVDARTGEPISKVKVTVNGSQQSATTDEGGAFTLRDLQPGEIEMFITTVNYGLVKKRILLTAGKNAEAVIALNQEAATLTEHVTVTADPYETTQTNVASEQTLNKSELQALSSVLVGDPVRAAQALPGVVANDDFRSEFEVRGAGFDRVGLFLDGVLTENFVHTVQGGFPDTGSLSVINTDTVGAVSLMSGAFPVKYGDRTAAVLDVTTRDGNRVKPAGRIAASLSSVSGVVDGPLAKGRGSYLFAARKSYVRYLVQRVGQGKGFFNNPPVLNFADAQGKALYDLTPHNQIVISAIFGTFDYDRNRDRNQLGLNNVFRGKTRDLLVNAQWNYAPDPRFFAQTRFFGLYTSFNNTNRDDATLDDGHRAQFGVRSDINFLAHPRHRIEAGLYVRSMRADNLSKRFDYFLGALRDLESYHRRGTEQGYYAQDTWISERLGLALTGGGRVEHSSLTGETLFSPRASLGLTPGSGWRIRAAFGRYYQFADFEQLLGRFGNPGLRAERATHYNASVERLFGSRTRVLAEVYDREDANLFFSLSEPRLFANQVTFTEFPFRNALSGHARGVELTLQRRSANRLTGWVSYAYSKTRLKDPQSGLSFVSDFDQRHTINMYGSYRFTETFNLSGQWRYGSGLPVPGFFRQDGPNYFLASGRNLARVPAYSRVDVRLNKAFLFKRWKLTLTGEVLNLLNRENVRYAGFGGFGPRGEVFGHLDRILPILPSAGVVVEF